MALAKGDIESSICLTACNTSSEDDVDMEVVMEELKIEPLVMEDSMPPLFLWLDMADGILDLDTGLDPEDTLPDLRRMEAGVVMEVVISGSSRINVPPSLLMFWVQSCSMI